MTSHPVELPLTSPTPMTLRLRPALDREPPFDDEIPARHLQVVGPWDLPLPFESVATAAAPDAPPTIPMQRSLVTPPPDQWGRRFLIALLESAAGRRSLSQLSRHVAMPVLEALRNDAGAAARLAPDRRPGSVRTVRAFQPTDRTAEFSAVIQVGPRFRAVAARLEWSGEEWRCVRLQIG